MKHSLNYLFFYVHSYLDYPYIAWASTNVTKTNKIHLLPKQSKRIVFNEGFSSKENFDPSGTTSILQKCLKHFSDNYISTSNRYAQIQQRLNFKYVL